MKKICLFGMLVLLALTACAPQRTPTPAAPPPAPLSAPRTAPTSSPLASFVPGVDANCRTGPSVAYPILAVLAPESEYQVFGINEDASWLFINTSLTQCWVKLTTGEARGELGRMPLIAYGPAPAPIPEMAGGAGGSETGGSGATALPTFAPVYALAPILVFPITMCGSYTTESDCTNHACTWVPLQFESCGYPPVPCNFSGLYCK